MPENEYYGINLISSKRRKWSVLQIKSHIVHSTPPLLTSANMYYTCTGGLPGSWSTAANESNNLCNLKLQDCQLGSKIEIKGWVGLGLRQDPMLLV